MRKARIAVLGTTGKVIEFDPDATRGATLGTNVFLPDGSVGTPATVQAWLGLVPNPRSPPTGSGTIHHRLLQGLTLGDDHPQYTQWVQDEIITGQWTFRRPILGAFTDENEPGYSFEDSPNTGMFLESAGVIGFSAAATEVFSMGPSSAISFVQLILTDGSAGVPSLTFFNESAGDTGIYRVGENNMGISAGGALHWDINTTRVLQDIPLQGPSGSAAVPTYTFSADTDTGIYRVGANNLGIATGGALHWDINTTRTFQDVYAVVRNYTGVFVENPDYLNAGVQITTITGSDPLNNGIGNQLAFWEVGTGGAFTDRSYGFRIRHTGEIDLEGNLDWYRHENNVSGVLFMRFTRDSSQVQYAAGSVSAPIFTTLGDLNTGIYFPGADQLGITLGGVARFTLTTAVLTTTVPIHGPDGAANAPTYSFASDTDTGIYLGSSGNIGFSHSGTFRLALSASLFRVDVQLGAADGTAGAPSLSFNNDPNTGVYSVTADSLGISAGGTLRWSVNTTAVTSTLPRRGADGAASAPSYSFTLDTDNGMYRITTDTIGFATAGTLRLTLSATLFSSTLPIGAADGAAATPSFTFSGDLDTGFYRLGADNIGLATGGTLRWDVNTTRILAAVPFYAPDGAVGAPALTFGADTDTGIYRISGNVIGVATAGAEIARFSAAIFQVGTDAGVADRSISLNTAAGQNRDYEWRSGGARRWIMRCNSAAETGADAGSDFTLIAFDDAGVSLGTAYTISRATRQLAFNLGTSAAPSLTWIGDLDTGFYRSAGNTIGFAAGGVEAARMTSTNFTMGHDAATGANIIINSAAANNRDLRFSTAGSLRWILRADNQAESGSNAGSDLNLLARDDAAAALFTVLVVKRSTGQLRTRAGSAAVPSISEQSDTDTGFYWVGADDFGIATGGVLRFDISTAAVTSTLPWRGPDGAVGAPALSFSGDTDTGIYRIGADNFGLSTGGTLRWDISTAAITSTLPRRGQDGTAAAPAYSFSGDTDTGILRNGADQLEISAGGTSRVVVTTARVTATVPIRLQGYTVGTLPAGTVGDRAYVTDATAPAYGAVVAGGGAVTVPVFYDGANWITA